MTKALIAAILLAATTLHSHAQVDKWIQLASSADSTAFQKQLDPRLYGIEPVDLGAVEQWKNDEKISGDSLFKLLSNWNPYPTPKGTGIICRLTAQVDTNLSVPYFIYLPKHYNPQRKSVLLVYFKGGWLSRRELPDDYEKEIVKDNPTFSYLDEYNVVEVFPALHSSLAIYGNYGYQHLKTLVTETKKRFNIDDNKVFLAGYSDGGKTVYNASYLAQTDFACFYPINGAIVSPPFLPNWINRPLFSFVAKRDELTDPRSIRTKAEHARQLGAEWTYRELDKTHYYKPYAGTILPTMFQHILQTSRNPFPQRIAYDRSFNDPAIKGIDWLQIYVNTKKTASPFHFTDSIRTFSGSGEERNYLYGEKTGQVRADFFNNTFTITTSQVDSITIFISPLMVDMDAPVRIIINNKERFNGIIHWSKEFMAERFLQEFDKSQLFVNKVDIRVEE